MRYSYFDIKNYKGIAHVHLDFDSEPRSTIYTLVGLNESGKTTILEALNSLTYRVESLEPLNLPGYSVDDPHELIPISKRSNFNDTIKIEVGFKLNNDDNKNIKSFLRKELKFELSDDISDFSITQEYKFEDSQLVGSQPKSLWGLRFKGTKLTATGKPSKSKKLSTITAHGATREQWLTAIGYVRTLLPSILYFPNFLFEFPDKIYLEDVPSDAKKHEFYRTILQDVLDGLEENVNLEKHVLERAKSNTKHDKQALESVLLKMGSHISAKVFTSWNNIFKRKIGNKEIIVNCDSDEKGKWFLQLRLKDSNELYFISERSLGFRWFFAFLLLTQYRGFRKDSSGNVLFLFDEPASNLHPSAQSQLLESFGNFPHNCSIIYTTHSHHMINPDWLEGTFVVKNEGLDYAESDSYVARNTVIVIDKYRNFAAQHPNQTTYFQPVLDVLDYSPNILENVPDVIMVEGKNDFYTLKYVQEILLQRPHKLQLMPGGGAGSLDDVIRLYLGWGRQFIVLLDSDSEGAKQKQRYQKLFGSLVEERIFSLSDIDVTWKKSLEFVFSDSDRDNIQRAVYPSSKKFSKTHFNRAVQELYLTKQKAKIKTQTESDLVSILDFCAGKIG